MIQALQVLPTTNSTIYNISYISSSSANINVHVHIVLVLVVLIISSSSTCS